MAKKIIPRPDADFSAWSSHYYETAEAYWSAHGLDHDVMDKLKVALLEWQAAYAAHVAAQAAAESARQAKDAARASLESKIRPVTAFIQSYPKTTDADRAQIGITVRDTTRTLPGAPTTAPIVLAASGGRLTHALRIVGTAESSGGASSRGRGGRPRGVDRAEVFVALTPTSAPAPTDPGAFRYVGSVTRGETTLSFESDKGGQQAHYIARWVSSSGGHGPWSETASATVAA